MDRNDGAESVLAAEARRQFTEAIQDGDRWVKDAMAREAYAGERAACAAVATAHYTRALVLGQILAQVLALSAVDNRMAESL